MSIKTYATAVRDTIAAEMRRDPKVFVMGEDVETIGSIFGCTRDLTSEFGIERAFNTPISEAGFVGAGLGAACTGMRPIVELMYMDFSFVAMDQRLIRPILPGAKMRCAMKPALHLPGEMMPNEFGPNRRAPFRCARR